MGPLRECRVGRLRDYYYLWQSYQQNGCMRRLCCLIISWLLGFAVHAQTGTDDSASRAAFDSVVSEVEAHYAGYFDKVPPPTRATYVAMVEELRAGLPTRNADASIGKYLGWFQDMHLYARIGGKRLVSFERKAVNYADSVDYKPSFFSGPVDGNCFLIRIPSLQVRDGARQFIAKAVRQYKRSRRPYLIIDLRGNGGGADGVYHPLVALAFGNQEIAKAIGASVNKPDSLAVLREEYTRSFKTISAYPRRIAVIIDNQVASNAEDLVLTLQSVSDRVVLYGREPSLGCVDYVNPRPFAVPSLNMVVYIPTTRSGRLPEHPVDPEGIAPEVIIPLPLPQTLTDHIDPWTYWVAEHLTQSE